jgi:septin family protein
VIGGCKRITANVFWNSLLVVGAKNSGKTSFLNFLRQSLALPPNKHPIRSSEDILEEINSSSSPNFTSHYLETEIEGERVGLTLWDSEGLEKNVVDLQLRDMTAFLESKFEDTLTEEMKVVRSPGARDTHIHCVFLILDPVRLDSNLAAAQKAAGQASGKYTHPSRVVGILDEDLDLQVLRVMQGKTAVVPVISKADTITTAHMAYLKKAVWDSLKQARIDPLEVLILEEAEEEEQESSGDDEEDEEESDVTPVAEHDESDKLDKADTQKEANGVQSPEKIAKASPPRSHKSNNSISTTSTTDTPFIPLSILSPDSHSLETPELPIGRYFPWGYADPYNPDHCDFVKLKESVFKDWRAELREASREVCYERWRTSRLHIKQAPKKPFNTSAGRYGPPPARGGRATR